jgi:phosphomannomutase
MISEQDLRAAAERWMEGDVDPVTQAELRALLQQKDLARTDLADRFTGALEFGTAGLRGVIGAGPNRMNRAVVLRTTLGLARYLLAEAPDANTRGVVVGYDGRRMSRELAEDTAAVLAAAGIPAHLFDEVVPTPLTAFAVTALGAAAGVMVTASHNPPEYNGYKVYWGNGAQIIPPHDVGIAAQIDRTPSPREVPRMSIDEARAAKLVRDVAPSVERAYLDRVRALQVHAEGDRTLSIVYTPLHGTGDKLARIAFAEAGFKNVVSVPEQQAPDAAFPTVAFPNPEEKGSMDLAFALARAKKADLVVANDPDADRLAVAIPLASSPTGYFQLTGNQVGVLLGHYLLTETKDRDPRRVVLASIVSSPLLGVIAAALGVGYEETLTGFKWIANRAMQLEAESKRFVFGYEEALGYSIGDVVRDKDGISAAVIVAEIAAWLRTRTPGKRATLLDELEAIHRRYGLFVSSQVNVTKPGAEGAAEIRALMDRLRASRPGRFGAFQVVAIRDYLAQTTTRTRDGAVTRLTLPTSNVLAFELEGGSRIIARPSGTEPKIKFYFDVREPMSEGEPLASAEARAMTSMAELTRVFVALASGKGEQGNRT